MMHGQGRDDHFIYRSALTLVELLIVIAIIATLVGLLIAAVQRARTSSIRLESMNQMKQIMLAVHHFSSAHSGKVPGLSARVGWAEGGMFFAAILYYVDPGQFIWIDDPRGSTNPNKPPDKFLHAVKLYMSPADPSFTYYPDSSTTNRDQGNCSYAVNYQALKEIPSIVSSFSDGTSNTIALGEHYARCSTQYNFGFNVSAPPRHRVDFPSVALTRRASFAEPDYNDVVPITLGNPPVTRGSVPNKTFQSRPAVANCDGSILQTAHSGGMLTAYIDGSVRTTAATIDEFAFWSLVTPRGGELGRDN